ncbi:uncharacterized protein LOC134266318, partial [Saccostrea cucullata]|uniref:uncharacterized protein LOC134266318 n=1 Tax=Saccostrea cuccullata TaxID=36930 RepID=UPI002ED3BF16
MKREEQIEIILTALACRSAGVPEDMLPLPQNYEEILDFGEEPVKDSKSKLEILKFSHNWCDMVEEEEVRQENALKVELEKQKIRPQIKANQEMLNELKTVVSMMELKRLEIQQQKELTKSMLTGLKEEVSRRVERRVMKEKQKIIWRSIHQEMMREVTSRVEGAFMKQKLKKIWTSVYQEMMREVSSRDERTSMREILKTIWTSIHTELMTVVSMMALKRLEIQQQKKLTQSMLTGLK